MLDSISGNVGFYYKNLANNEEPELAFNHEATFIAASIIKLPMAVALEQLIVEGEINHLSKLTICDSDKMPGAGGLSLIPGKFEISIRGLINNMIALSDNTAANKLLRLVSIRGFNDRFKQMGLEKTRVNRLLFDEEAHLRGLNNYFGLPEIMVLLQDLYNGEKYGKEASNAVMSILRLQKVNHKIPCRIPSSVAIAHKTGEDERTTHDVGIVFSKKPFLIGFASNDVDVYEMEDAIKNISLQLYLRNAN